MGKDLKGKELGTGLRQRKDGRYEARAKINGIDINLYDVDLKKLKILFEKAKEEARNNIDMKRQKITLNEWFEEWFANYKIPNIKETSVFPMRSKYYNTFGKAIGNMKVTDIRNLDIQRVINDMNKQGRASSSMRDALGRVRECLESAKNNRIIDINPCFEINVPWENKTAEEIHNLVRGLNPIMGAYSELEGKKVKFWKVNVVNLKDLSQKFPELKEYEYRMKIL